MTTFMELPTREPHGVCPRPARNACTPNDSSDCNPASTTACSPKY
ncbi:hypothetical protein [Streptomyces sp. NPDC057554]